MKDETMTVTFRLAKVGQLQEIRALFFKSMTYIGDRMGVTTPSDAWSNLQTYLDNRDLYVAVENDTLVGAVAMREVDNGLYVDEIAIHPAHQNKGIGTKLIHEVELIAESRESKALQLHTPEVMTELLSFYMKRGFHEVRRQLPSHGRDNVRRVIFEKAIALSDSYIDTELEHDRQLI